MVVLSECWLLANYNYEMPSHQKHRVLVNRNCSHEPWSRLTQRQHRSNCWSHGSCCLPSFGAFSPIYSSIFKKWLFGFYIFFIHFSISEALPWLFAFYRISIWEKMKKLKELLEWWVHAELVSLTHDGAGPMRQCNGGLWLAVVRRGSVLMKTQMLPWDILQHTLTDFSKPSCNKNISWLLS